MADDDGLYELLAVDEDEAKALVGYASDAEHPVIVADDATRRGFALSRAAAENLVLALQNALRSPFAPWKRPSGAPS